MSDELHKMAEVTTYWKEIIGLATAILVFFGLMKTRSEEKMLTTRGHLKSTLSDNNKLIIAELKLSQRESIEEAVGKVYRKIDTCKSDVSNKINEHRKEQDAKINAVHERINRI